MDQALRVRDSRDFADRAAYDRFLQELVRQRNLTRQARFAVEQQALRLLPAAPLAPCRELRVTVGRFSTIHLLNNTYSVPSRLIGTTLTVRLRAETVEAYVGTQRVRTLPRPWGARTAIASGAERTIQDVNGGDARECQGEFKMSTSGIHSSFR